MNLNEEHELKPISLEDKEFFEAYFDHSARPDWYQQPWYFNHALMFAQPYLMLWKIIDYCLCIFGRTDDDFFLYVPPLGSGNVSNVVNECFGIIEYEGFEAKIMCDYPDFERCIDKDLYVSKHFDVNYINDTILVTILKGNKFKTLRHNVNKFRIEQSFKYIKFNPDLHTIEAKELIEKYHQQSEDFDDVEYNLNLLSNVSALGLRATVLTIDEQVKGLNVGVHLNDHTMGYLINKVDTSIKYLVDYTRWRFHADAKSLGYRYVNDGSDLDSKGLQRLKKKFAPIAILELYSWKRAEIESLDMSG